MGLEEKIEKKLGQRVCNEPKCSRPEEIKRLQLFRVDFGSSVPAEKRYQFETLPFCDHGIVSRYDLKCRGSHDEVIQRARTLVEQNRIYNWEYFDSDISELSHLMIDKCTTHREPEDVKGVSFIRYDYGANVAKKARYEFELVAYCACGKGADYVIAFSDTSKKAAMEQAKWLHTEFGLPMPTSTIELRRSPWLKWRNSPPIERTSKQEMLNNLIRQARKPRLPE